MNQKDYNKEEIEAFLMEIKPFIMKIVEMDEQTEGCLVATQVAGIITRHFYESLTGRTIEQEKEELFAQLIPTLGAANE